MLGLLEGIEEYNNQGALLGLDGSDLDQFYGELKKMNPIRRAKTMSKLASMGAPSRGSRAEMEKFFGELPPHIKEALLNGNLRLADTMLYSIKSVNSKTIKLWEDQDVKEIGLRNISGAKQPKNQAILVSGIQFLVGTAADPSKDKILATDFKGIEHYPAICNGEFSLRSNKKQIVPESSNSLFRTAGFNNVPIGYYKLANPRLIPDDVLIEFTVELGSTEGIPANTYIYVGLHGTCTTP